MKTTIDIALFTMLSIDIGISLFAVFKYTILTPNEKRVLRKTCRFYEDVGIYLAEHTTKPEVIADDLKAIDKLKEKIK